MFLILGKLGSTDQATVKLLHKQINAILIQKRKQQEKNKTQEIQETHKSCNANSISATIRV
jgi:hypothetical protein